jgi:hypothetical protein
VIIGIVVAAVVVMATAIVIVACLFYRRKRGKANSRDIDSIQNTAYEGHDTPRNIELQKIPDPESVYEEPAEYTQLASSLREPVDANYQSLLNVQNYEQPDTSGYNEKFQQYASMNMESNPRNEVPGESDYETIA